MVLPKEPTPTELKTEIQKVQLTLGNAASQIQKLAAMMKQLELTLHDLKRVTGAIRHQTDKIPRGFTRGPHYRAR